MALAVIPARGNSKRIPRKNIRPFAGKPMIAWPIEVALASGSFDRVIVSTGDDEVADIAQAHGAEVPFRRPAELSHDKVPTRPVMVHAIEQVQALHGPVEHVCCIYPTAPLLGADTIRSSKQELIQTGADFVFSCTTFPYPILRALRITDDGSMEMIWPEHLKTRSQDLEQAYHDAGQFYWGRADAFLEGKPMFGPGSRPWVLPRHLVQDIDTPEDWIRAELAFQVLRGRSDDRLSL
ncbi:pseudaminic acid cytidylyltransferase [Maricaulis sp.]|uniref:pseudaminic acid cytidylyltransferase n=1 Tax=Maricaulis sp. TaxID=1486257 RepID=UPI0026089F7B|nr:pseudaminic acid cytidylyltransferase [Maricaulis sp.]